MVSKIFPTNYKFASYMNMDMCQPKVTNVKKYLNKQWKIQEKHFAPVANYQVGNTAKNDLGEKVCFLF